MRQDHWKLLLLQVQKPKLKINQNHDCVYCQGLWIHCSIQYACCDRFNYPVILSRDVTDDEAFVDELRVTLRFFAAVLVRRTQKVTNS